MLGSLARKWHPNHVSLRGSGSGRADQAQQSGAVRREHEQIRGTDAPRMRCVVADGADLLERFPKHVERSEPSGEQRPVLVEADDRDPVAEVRVDDEVLGGAAARFGLPLA